MLSGDGAVMTFARVAQWLEHYTDNVGVHGSNPCARTIIAQKLAALAVSKAGVDGSIPSAPTRFSKQVIKQRLAVLSP